MNKVILTRIPPATWIPAALVCFMGLFTVWAWETRQIDLMLRRPDFLVIYFNTGLCFLMAGLALPFLLHQKTSFQIAGNILLVCLLILSSAVLVENLLNIDLRIDRAEMHRLLFANIENPGRMSPYAALSFQFFSIAALLHRHARRPFLKALSGFLIFFVFVLGLLGLISYFLSLSSLYPDLFRQIGIAIMALPTSCGLMLLALGLWRMWYRDYLQRLGEDEAAVKEIDHATLFVVCTLGLMTSIVGLAFLQSTLKDQASLNLSNLHAERATLIKTALGLRVQRALVASSQITILDAVKVLHAQPDDPASLARLRQAGELLLNNGFTNVTIEVHGKQKKLAGKDYNAHAFIHYLADTDGAILSWHSGGYFLRVAHPLKDPVSGTLYGYFLTEQSLETLDQLDIDTRKWGQTGEMVICERAAPDALQCFPHRTAPEPFQIAATYLGEALPMTHALQHEVGVTIANDYRGRPVIAAYGPIGQTGLGMVVKMELAEIYAPIREKFEQALPVILLLMLFGFFLIRSRIRPLVARQVFMRADAERERSYFVAAAESSPDAFFILESRKDKSGAIVDFTFSYLNRNVKRAFPNVTEEVTGTSFLAKFPHRLNFFEKYKKVAETGKVLDEEFSWTIRGQPSKWINLLAVQMPQGVAVTWRDLTGKRNSERLLEQANRLRKTIVDSAAYSIISTDGEGTILSFNLAAERLLGYSAHELVNRKSPAAFHDPEEVVARAASLSEELGRKIEPGFETFVAKAKLGLNEEREWTYIRKDGSRVPVRLSVTALRDADDKLTGFLGVAHDITEQKRLAEYMQHVALHDVLTGLPNRALLDDRMHQAINGTQRTGRSFALVLLDIDRFKQINDTLGHHVGDQVLVEFVARVKTCMRPGDTFARMGGDEFVMIFPGSGAEDVSAILMRVQQTLLPPMSFGGRDLQVTSSMGVSIAPEHGKDQITLMHQADVAMYQVKQQGRNGFRIFSPEVESTLAGAGAE